MNESFISLAYSLPYSPADATLLYKLSDKPNKLAGKSNLFVALLSLLCLEIACLSNIYDQGVYNT
jgi:hypothetical protein